MKLFIVLLIAFLLCSCGDDMQKVKEDRKAYTEQVKNSYHVITYIDKEYGNICYMYVSDMQNDFNTPIAISCLPLKENP